MKKSLFVYVVISFLFIACANTSKTQKGAAIGAATGATAGALLDHHKRGRGAAIGAAVGGITGAYIGKQEDREDTHKREEAMLRDEIYRAESETRLREREAFASSFKSVILFDFNSSRLNDEGHREVRHAVEQLKRYPDMHIMVKGYADTSGSANYNMTLSRNRAEAVKNALIEFGISPSKIHTSGYGETSYTQSGFGKQISRRVEISAALD